MSAPTKPLILITGATGHIGFATLHRILSTGAFRTRISTRSLSSKAAKALEAHPTVAPHLRTGDVEVIEVPNFLASGAFAQAMKGVDFVLHIASPIPDENIPGDIQDVYINPAINGTIGILESALKVRTIKRVVIVSSVAILKPSGPGRITGPDDLMAVPDLKEIGTNPWVAYRASKILAHAATVEWLAAHPYPKERDFDVVQVLPSYVQGRNDLATSINEVRSGSNDVMVDLCLGVKGTLPRPANLVLHDDVAEVLVRTLDAKRGVIGDGERFIAAYPQSMIWDDVPLLAEKLFPEAVEKGILPLGGTFETVESNFDVRKTEEKLQIEFHGLETMVESVIGQYIELS